MEHEQHYQNKKHDLIEIKITVYVNYNCLGVLRFHLTLAKLSKLAVSNKLQTLAERGCIDRAPLREK